MKSYRNSETPEEMLERWESIECQCDPETGFFCERCHDIQTIKILLSERDRLRAQVPRGAWIEFSLDGSKVLDILHEPRDAEVPNRFVWCQEYK